MGEFVIRVATAADVDRLWPLLDEREDERPFLADATDLEIAEMRRSALVAQLLDPARATLIAYSGVRIVGYTYSSGDRPPYVSASWRGLGIEEELEEARSAVS